MSKSNNIDDLREAMFDTLAKLKAGELSVEQAKAASQIGGVLIEAAKVEVEFLRVNDDGVSNFFTNKDPEALPPGVVGVTRHRLVG